MRKPSGARKRSVTPLAPETVEEMRHWLPRRNLIRDATLVSVLAYAGLRPGEAFALTWVHVRERTLLIEAAVSLGQITETMEPSIYEHSPHAFHVPAQPRRRDGGEQRRHPIRSLLPGDRHATRSTAA